MSATLDRARLEDFVYVEAALLDAWALEDWLALFDDPCTYEVAPTGLPDPLGESADTTLFLISDDHGRLEQRVIRIMKTSAHVEYPHSKTRHLYSNVRLLSTAGEEISISLNFVTYRTKRGVTTSYVGRIDYLLARRGDGLMIRSKRVGLDLDNLVPQGKVSIFL